MRDSIAWLYGLERFGVRLGLERMRLLLDRLGRPESAFPSVLVGGTNGKGSVAATLDAILGEAGARTGLYTSPHLVRPSERIRIQGHDIAPARLSHHLDAIRDAMDGAFRDRALEEHPSFFEVMTATALHAFRDAAVDVAILEVGLGGRLDATNAVAASLSVIVTVDLDHVDRLGTTLEEIAAEKAGIVKPGRPLVSGVAQDAARRVLLAACLRERSPFVDARERARAVENGDGSVTIATDRTAYPDLRPALAGRHQIDNLRVAVVAAEMLPVAIGIAVPPDAVREGVAAVRWPGRLQTIPGSPPILLDGAHNAAGAKALAEDLAARAAHPLVLVLGVSNGKDFAGILEPLADLAATVVLTRSTVDRASDPERLASVAARRLACFEVAPGPAEALERARRLAGPRGLVVVAGSLYLVGDVLGILEGGTVPGPLPL